MTELARVGTIADKPNHFPDAVPTLPRNDSISPGAFLSPGAGAPFRCVVPPRSQLPGASALGLSIRVLRRREFGDYAVQDGAELLHAHQHAGAHFHEARKDRAKTGTAYARCS